MATNVAGDFAAAGRMADQGDTVQFQRVDQRRQVIGVSVHIVAVPTLT
jgi:hypothetical protein